MLLSDSIVERIESMESQMIELPQVEIPVIDRWVNGMYMREITIPKGTLLTGRVHLFDYADIMLSGDISVATADGCVRYTGPNVFTGVAGRKRAGYAHEDTRWITVHRTEIKTGEEFVNKLTVFSMKDYSNILEATKCQLLQQQ